MARNPFHPGVGTTPPYLADRDEQLQRFNGYLRDFPDKRRNVRLSGLRGVGKTVLLKEYPGCGPRARLGRHPPRPHRSALPGGRLRCGNRG